ncbi:DegT/DnrJ/EryC1/StrS family aminotransferase [Compostibacter hankyongensis]|uniref:DegT/DnrJ/EryC1/StrS family aminotransferase n=1 Tax=Compostibacter hankyongensis TaxID=1007089 RepID=A0ABP8G9H1_9BACT
MKKPAGNYSRRKFIIQNSLAGTAAIIGMNFPHLSSPGSRETGAPAILGGSPAWAPGQKPEWVKWPIWVPETDEPRVLEVLRSGVWSEAKVVKEFENAWAKTIGARRCVTTVNGTNALICALVNLDIGAGDEVIVPPYTFIATIQAVLQTGAIPVFVDTDPETFQIDAGKIEASITPRTRAILPVHIAGLPADMEQITAIAKRHNLVVVEDACQAWLAEINHKKVGTFGNAGCFSFQNSKNIPIGEGGAVVSDDETFIDRCVSYHNFGISYGSMVDKMGPGITMIGTKLRLTEYQAAMGLAQLKRLDTQTTTRNENAGYLRSRLMEIPGITPYKLYDNVTRAAFHLFPFRYEKNEFAGLPKAGFLSALRAEGVPCSGGYDTLNDKPFIRHAFQTKNFKKMYSETELDYNKFLERNQCPENDRLCQEAVWFTQNLLLGSKTDMDYIASAIEKIHKNAGKIKKTDQK